MTGLPPARFDDETDDVEAMLPEPVIGDPDGDPPAPTSKAVSKILPGRARGQWSQMIRDMAVGAEVRLDGANIASIRNMASNTPGVFTVRKSHPGDNGQWVYKIKRKA